MKKYNSLILLGVLFVSSVQSFSPAIVPKHAHHHASVKRSARGIRTPIRRRETSLSVVPLDVVTNIYNQALLTNPLETKLATGGVLALMGDYVAQSRELGEYDTKRAGALVSFDMMYRAVQCALFPEITRVCDGHYLATVLSAVDVNILSTLEQTITNQFIVIPIIYYPLFFSLTSYIQGLSIDESIERVKTTVVPLLMRNWAFWIPVQYFQFGYVDEPLQIPFLCVVGLAWTFILSSYAGSAQKSDLQEVEAVAEYVNFNDRLMKTEEEDVTVIAVETNSTVTLM